MANIKSQIKRNRQNELARQRNQAARSRLKTMTRRFRESLAAGNVDEAQKALRAVCRAYDKASSAGILHANNAANHKAKLQKAFNTKTAAA